VKKIFVSSIILPSKKPRNPLVPASIKRKAGKHRDKKKEDKLLPIKE
jgi:hypothetical protein